MDVVELKTLSNDDPRRAIFSNAALYSVKSLAYLAKRIQMVTDNVIRCYCIDGSIYVYDNLTTGHFWIHDPEKAQERLMNDEKTFCIFFSRQLQWLMDEKGINQFTFSEMLGISQSTLSNYLCAKRVPTVSLLYRMSYILEVDYERFFDFM